VRPAPAISVATSAFARVDNENQRERNTSIDPNPRAFVVAGDSVEIGPRLPYPTKQRYCFSLIFAVRDVCFRSADRDPSESPTFDGAAHPVLVRAWETVHAASAPSGKRPRRGFPDLPGLGRPVV
jgi:hypothetical protein